MKPLYTFKEVCTLLHIGCDKLYGLIARGEITGFKIGKTWRFSGKELERYIDAQTESARV